MPRSKCRKCGLINFASAQACKRCGVPMQEPATAFSSHHESGWQNGDANTWQGRTSGGRIMLKPRTLNGVGVDLRAYKQLSPGIYQVTRCFTFIGIPVLPINNWVIRPLSFETGVLQLSERHSFELLDQQSLDLESLIRLYGSFIFWITIATAPFALLLSYMSSHRLDSIDDPNRPGLLTGIFFLLSVPWCVGIIIWLKRRRDRIFTRSQTA